MPLPEDGLPSTKYKTQSERLQEAALALPPEMSDCVGAELAEEVDDEDQGEAAGEDAQPATLDSQQSPLASSAVDEEVDEEEDDHTPGTSSSRDHEAAPAIGPDEQVNPTTAQPSPPKDLKDLVKGELADTPWQHEKYKSTSALCQGAALRRKQHFRRTNASLGVC